MAMDTIDIIFLRFKTKLLPYCDQFLKILIKTFAVSKIKRIKKEI
jgi:hypothetical protein